jgi:hypothetical protein
MHVRIAKRRAGGIASFPLSVKSSLYFAFASSTSLNIVLIVTVSSHRMHYY